MQCTIGKRKQQIEIVQDSKFHYYYYITNTTTISKMIKKNYLNTVIITQIICIAAFIHIKQHKVLKKEAQDTLGAQNK